MPPAGRKPDTKTTTGAPAAAAPPEVTPAETTGPDASYSGQAAKLAADARGAVEQMREQLWELVEQVSQVQQTAPDVTESAVADGVRRIPMAVGEVVRAMQGLQAAASELAQRAAG